MDRFDPNEWTPAFVTGNKEFCLDFLQETNERVIELLNDGTYDAATVGIDRMLNGAVVINNAGAANMMPFLATYSFNQGIIIVCGLEGVPEDKRRKTAIAAFADARDFSKGDLGQIADDVVKMLESGYSLSSVKEKICPDFPADLIGLMSRPVTASPSSSASGGLAPRKKSALPKIVTAVIAGIMLISFIASRLSGGKSVSNKADFSGEGNISDNAALSDDTSQNEAGEEYTVTASSGLMLRSGPSTDAEVLEKMPLNSVIVVYEIKDGWASAKFEEKTGYCSEEYIVKNSEIKASDIKPNEKAYSLENMYFYSEKSASSETVRYTVRGEEVYIDGVEGNWARVNCGEKDGFAPIAKLSSSDVPFVPEYTGKPGKALFESLIYRCSYDSMFPESVFRDMMILNENDSYPVYFEDSIATYGHTAKGINTVEDVKNIFRNFCTEQYLNENIEFDNMQEHNGKLYFNENFGMGWNTELVAGFSQPEPNKWIVKTSYEYNPDSENEVVIVLEDGKYKIAAKTQIR